MMALLIEAAARATLLALIAAAGLRLVRLSAGRHTSPSLDPHVEKAAWTAVLAASLAMPALMHAVAAPLIPAPAYLLEVAGAAALHSAPQRQAHGPYGLGIGLYVLIATGALLRMAAGWLYAWRAYRRAEVITAPWTQGMQVRVSTQLTLPATFGSTILLPATHREWTAFKRDAVLAHERSHVLERDAYLLWLAQLHVCVFWFSPLAWWLRRRLAALAEATADDAALRTLGDRPGYAQVLLEFASLPRPIRFGATLSMAHQSQIPARIERILGAPSDRPDVSQPLRRRLPAVAGVVTLAAAVAAVQLAHTKAAHGQTPAAATSQGSNGQGPRLVTHGVQNRLKNYYPPVAAQRGINGEVLLAVTLDRESHATKVRVLSEQPADQGFGAAASRLANELEYSNPQGQPAELSFTVHFRLGSPN